MREILDEVIVYVERHGAAVEQAVDTLWPRLVGRLTSEERESLARRGLNASVHVELSRMRYVGPSAENTVAVRAQTTRDEVQPVTVRVTMWERVRYETADGGTAPLIKFLVTDWEAFEHRVAVEARGKLRIKRFARKMIRTCQEHGVDRTADLPEDILAELAAASPWATD